MKDKNKFNFITLHPSLHRDHKHFPFSLIGKDENLSEILRIKEIIDRTTENVFISYKNKLLKEPITYIIPAVWGKIKYGELTHNQVEIYQIIDPAVADIMEILELDDTNDSQRFAIEYLIRGLIISKITYLIEASRRDHQQNSEYV